MLWFNKKEKNMGKTILQSKTFWVNLIAVGYSIYQMITKTPAPMSMELQVAILGGINFILRLVTKDPIVWK